ncbi:hypothetical protein HMPREF0577_1078 [Mobiluncus mulieris ATCC 35243]|nr:hypothetical protein HMPREF0577_1078 [Mobiluncus mulieris ATCC 35243]
MSSFVGCLTVLSSCIWCPRGATRLEESSLFDITIREIPVGRRNVVKPDGTLGLAKAR